MIESVLTLAAFGYFLYCLHVIREIPKEGLSKKSFVANIVAMCVVAILIAAITLYLVN